MALKMKLSTIVLAALCLAAVLGMRAKPDFGSYFPTCNGTHVTFINFNQSNCLGGFTTYSDILNTCSVDQWGSWEGYCNSTNMWFANYKGNKCEGKSLLTRMYTMSKCFNCPNKECKNG